MNAVHLACVHFIAKSHEYKVGHWIVVELVVVVRDAPAAILSSSVFPICGHRRVHLHYNEMGCPLGKGEGQKFYTFTRCNVAVGIVR